MNEELHLDYQELHQLVVRTRLKAPTSGFQVQRPNRYAASTSTQHDTILHNEILSGKLNMVYRYYFYPVTF